MDAAGHEGLKARAIQELRRYLVISLYLWVLLGSFAVYRRLIAAEAGTAYVHYGIALVEALIIGKVVLIGSLFGFTRRFEDRPLIVPVVYKSIVFGVLVLAFGVVEHGIDGWIHHKGFVGGMLELRKVGFDELCARIVTLIVALVPLFAFEEIGRVIGAQKLAGWFFAERGPARDGA